MWIIEFYNEAEGKSLKPNKAVIGNTLSRKDTIPEEPPEKPQEVQTGGPETPDPDSDPIPDVPKETSPTEETKSQDEQPQSDKESDPSKESEDIDTPEGEEEHENKGRAPKLSQTSQDSSTLDEEYVIIENEKQNQKEERPKPGSYFFSNH